MTKLKKGKDGQYVIDSLDSASAVRAELDATLAELAEWEEMPEFKECREKVESLQAALNAYVIAAFKASEGYEDDQWRGTKVVGHRREWDIDGLRKAISGPLYKAVIDVKIDGQKVDELVRAGKLDLNAIKRFYTEKANKPSVKWTRKTVKDGEREDAQAAELDDLLAD